MSNSKCNNSAGDIGRGPELKYEFYFPPNSCMPKDAGMSKCPETFNYPLQNIPSCKSIYVPCAMDTNSANNNFVNANSVKINSANTNTNVNAILEPQPSELYGDALGMNEGDGLFYYNDPYGFNLTALTYEHRQPYHYARTSY
jgi:hypothetical protein